MGKINVIKAKMYIFLNFHSTLIVLFQIQTCIHNFKSQHNVFLLGKHISISYFCRLIKHILYLAFCFSLTFVNTYQKKNNNNNLNPVAQQCLKTQNCKSKIKNINFESL